MINYGRRNHYRVLLLNPETDVTIDDNDLFEIDITRAHTIDAVTSDRELQSCNRVDHLRYASGGGSYIFEDDWMLIVQRDAQTRVNPGKYSLFTGRANSLSEYLQPRLMFRELFEELHVYDQNGSRIIPVSRGTFASAISTLESQNLVRSKFVRLVPSQDANLPTKRIRVTWHSMTSEDSLPLMKSQQNDVFILCVVRVPLQIWKCRFQDHENKFRKRKLFALHIETRRAIPIAMFERHTSPYSEASVHIDDESMTEHLFWVINCLI